jgi:hypothetical protein
MLLGINGIILILSDISHFIDLRVLILSTTIFNISYSIYSGDMINSVVIWVSPTKSLSIKLILRSLAFILKLGGLYIWEE